MASVSKVLNPFLERIIKIPKNDFRKIILLQLSIFLIITVLLILKPYATSIMLGNYGIDVMPLAFMGIAIAAVLIHLGLISIRRFLTLKKSIAYNFIFHIIVISALALATYYNLLASWMTIVVYVYVNMFSVITVTLFFQYCQSLLSIREAKKVLSHIGVGAIAGGVFGGYFTSATVSYLGNVGLLFSAAVFLILAAISLREVDTSYNESMIEHSDSKSWSDTHFMRIIQNRHVMMIVGITLFGVMASKLVDYIFNHVALLNFTEQASLTAFFGFWYSTINVIGLLIQLFLVHVLLDRFGVSKAMSIMPILIIISLFTFIFLPVLSIGILIKLVDGSLKQSLYKTASEINIMPLPITIRDRAKTLVDVVVDSIATGVSGIIIYILMTNDQLPFKVIVFTTIFIVLIWILLISYSTKSYVQQLSNLIFREDVKDEDIPSTPKEYLLQLIEGAPRKSPKRFKRLVQCTYREDTAIRSAAIDLIAEEFQIRGLKRLSHILEDSSILVRKKYFEELLKYTDSSVDVESLYDSLPAENKVVFTGALSKIIGYRPQQQDTYRVLQKIEQSYTIVQNLEPRSILWRTWMTAVAHARYTRYYSIMASILQNEKQNDKLIYVFYAIRKSKLKKFFPALASLMVRGKYRKRWYKTLASFPNKLLNLLKAIEATDTRMLKRLLPALQFIDSQNHVDFLFTLLQHHNKRVRVVALRVIGQMSLRFPFLNYTKAARVTNMNKILRQVKEVGEEIFQIKKFIHHTELEYGENQLLQRGIIKLKNVLGADIHVLFVTLSLALQNDELLKCHSGLLRGKYIESLDYLDQILPYRLKKRILPVLKSTIDLYSEIPDILEVHPYDKRPSKYPRLKKLAPKAYRLIVSNKPYMAVDL